MISIGKDAAKNRLGRELVDEVLAECRVCTYKQDHTFHTPAAECKECLLPGDHHEYQPWEKEFRVGELGEGNTHRLGD